MSLKGTVRIDRYKAEIIDGQWVPIELTGTFEQTNRITPNLIDYIREGVATGRTDMVTHVNEAMMLGAMVCPTDNTTQGWVGATVANAATYNAGVEGGVDSYWEIQSTVNGKGVGNGSRFIRTIALTSNSASYDNKAWTIVNLPTPCEQGETEILQITYRIINDQSAIAALNTVNYNVSEAIFANNTHGGSTLYTASTPHLLTYDDRVWGKGVPEQHYVGNQVANDNAGSVEIYLSNVETDYNSVSVAEGFHKARANIQLGINNIHTSESIWSGCPFKGITMGSNGRFTSIAPIVTGTNSAVQNIFPRAVDTAIRDRTPFLSNDIIASSAATVNLIDKGDWVGHRSDSYLIPYHYRISIEAGGNVGVSTYKLKRRRWTRWERNHLLWISYGIPILHCGLYGGAVDENYMDITTADTRKHGQTIWHSRNYSDSDNPANSNSTGDGDAGTLFQRYVYPEVITWDYDGLTIFSLNEHNWTNLDANSAQVQTFTEILQVSTDGLDIYVADASQGLYKIERDWGDFDTTNWTITKLSPPGITNTNSCRGVFHKGGTYWGGPGGVTSVNIIRGGSNYSVDDTVTIAGVNGTGATANVGAVDADGAITSVTVTAQGSGYIEDHIQLYVSTGSGWGATLDPAIGAGGNTWAIFNDITDTAVYMAHMTHLTTDATNLAFDSTGPETITRTGGVSDFLAEGFRPGQRLIIRTAEDAGNTGTFTITAVTTTVITVSENLFTNATDTQAQIFGENWEIMTETITDDSANLDFLSAGPDTITGDGTSFITQGFRKGMKIVVSSANTAANNGIYTIAGVTTTVITLDSQDVLATDATDITAVLSALTDFTLTTYTSGSPGGAGIIGLVMDQEHANDRFAILTPGTKYANAGIVQQVNGSWSWWSHGGTSTGTTTAGTTDEQFVTGNSNSYALSGEQIGTQCVGPLSDGDTWVVHGVDYNASARVDWGLTTLTAEGQDFLHKYIPHRCKTGFDIGVYGEGTEANLNVLKSNRVAADFTSSTEDSVISGDMSDGVFDNLVSLRPYYYGGDEPALHGQVGHGLLFGRLTSNDNNLQGGFLWTGNGSGLKSDEDAMPYGYWEDFGWDGTHWVLDSAGAKTTHGQVSFSGTGITITAATGAIVGAGFTDWATDGFLAGDIITIATSEDATNDGSYVIESLSGTTLTVTPDKLPAINSSAAPDETATVVGDHAIIDGLALSFDDLATIAPLVLDEYYDCYVWDGIVNDNATSGNIDVITPYMATATGTSFESSTIPSGDVGQVFNEPVTIRKKSAITGGTAGSYQYSTSPGVLGTTIISNAIDNVIFTEQQIPASTDFTYRFKVAGACSSVFIDTGVVPYSLSSDGTNYNDTIMDYNIRPVYDFANNPTHDIYTIAVRNTGSGAIQTTYNADRVVLIVAQNETSYDASPGTEGTFIGGFESATDTHASPNILTMDDGSTVTVDAVDGNGTVTEFTVTTNSTKSSGNSQIGAVSSSATLTNFTTTGNIITRTAGGTDFITDGFKIGMKIQVDAATTEANDGAYTIQSVTTTTIVTEENLNTTETGTSATIVHAIIQIASTGSGVNFALIPGADNLQAADVGNDEYALNRRGTTGDNLYWTLNDVEFYTHTGGPFNDQYNPCATNQATELINIYDANLDYTIDRRYLKIGNGTTTGADDTNFRCLPTSLAETDKLRLYYDSGAGPVEFTYVTDGATAPSSGEVTILPWSGRLWFNTAQATDTLTGNWTTTLKPNIE